MNLVSCPTTCVHACIVNYLHTSSICKHFTMKSQQTNVIIQRQFGAQAQKYFNVLYKYEYDTKVTEN